MWLSGCSRSLYRVAAAEVMGVMGAAGVEAHKVKQLLELAELLELRRHEMETDDVLLVSVQTRGRKGRGRR